MTRKTSTLFIAASLLATTVTSSSFAADAPAAAAPAADAPLSPARALFKEARELVSKGDYSAACPKFEQSLALEVGLGTQFNLADCWEHIGRTASAQALFVGAAASAKAAGQSDREQVLRDRAAALEPRIPRLVVEVADPDPKLVVKRGDLPLESDAIGKAKPVDPGSYEITAKAPGKKTWTKKVEVAAGSAVVTVEVPRLEKEDAPADAEAKKPEEVKPAAPLHDTAPPPSTASNKGPNVLAITLGGVAVAGLAVGTVMALKYRSANDDAKNTCPSSMNCTVEQIDFHDQRVDDARSARTWSFIGFGAGILSAGAAAAVLFLPASNPSERASNRTWTATPLIAADGSFGASVSGKF